ncbi:MAG: hypothetical protein K0R59_171 [Sphingobacterium sp.]|jgi:hypothetical protein|nr:hypothetical protein [Sphingobacterium sp.]
MKQTQTNGKGQGGRPTPEKCATSPMWNHPERRHSAALTEVTHALAGDQQILPGSCCCAGPVRDRHGRKFTTFPRMR